MNVYNFIAYFEKKVPIKIDLHYFLLACPNFEDLIVLIMYNRVSLSHLKDRNAVFDLKMHTEHFRYCCFQHDELRILSSQSRIFIFMIEMDS